MEGRVPPVTGTPQPRDLVRVAFGPSLVALVVIAAIVLVQLVVANSDLTGALGAVASMWLAVHLVPISIAGQQLGVLPLVPAALMVWATARSTAQVTPARGSWFVIRWILASALGGPLLMAALSLAVVHDAASWTDARSSMSRKSPIWIEPPTAATTTPASTRRTELVP